MAGSDDWSATYGNVTVRLTHLGNMAKDSLPVLPARIWRRAARLVTDLGVEPALVRMDERAERSLDRGDVASACRWRDLMTAVHSMSEEERLGREADH